MDNLGDSIKKMFKRESYFYKLTSLIIDKYPNDQQGYLGEYIRNMKSYRLIDLSNQGVLDNLIDKIHHFNPNLDPKTLMIFSNEAKHLLNKYVP